MVGWFTSEVILAKYVLLVFISRTPFGSILARIFIESSEIRCVSHGK